MPQIAEFVKGNSEVGRGAGGKGGRMEGALRHLGICAAMWEGFSTPTCLTALRHLGICAGGGAVSTEGGGDRGDSAGGR